MTDTPVAGAEETAPATNTTVQATHGITEITRPGIYDIPADHYHADPVPGGSLSSTGARKILPPRGCPALFRYEQLHGAPPRKTFDLGSAAHTLVLGTGAPVMPLSFDSLRTKAAREEAEEFRAQGGIPLSPAEYHTVRAMAEVMRRHPVTSALLRPGSGMAEQSLFWRDEHTGVMCRARPDWLPATRAGHRMFVTDYKTTMDASPSGIAASIERYGYHQQAAWYLDGVRALGVDEGADDVVFVFVFQQKTPPYLVTVVELDIVALNIGAARNRRALQVYAQCLESGIWPGFSEAVEMISLPPWVERTEMEEYDL